MQSQLQTLLFLGSFFLLLILATLAVGGWFFITRGWTEKLPDGSDLRKGKLFRGFYFFFTREKDKQRIYYQGAQLRALVHQFRNQFQNRTGDYDIQVFDAGVFIAGHTIYANKGVLDEISEALGFKWFNKGGGDYALYREFPVYYYPEWLRSPLAVCATCFSSLYGSAFYWTAMIFLRHGLYGWLRYPVAAMWSFWVAFCFSLAVTLTAVAKKYN